MDFGMALTFDETVCILDFNYNNPSFQSFLLPPGVFEKMEENKSLPTSISTNIDIVRLNVTLTGQCEKNKVLKSDEKSFFNTLLGVTNKEPPMGNYSNKILL